MSNSKFCVYLTTYFGNKMPPFYIGSTSLKKHHNGYMGSVRSKKYEKIWHEETKSNPTLFKTKLLSTHNTRKEAYEKEEKLQKSLNVIKNPMYINMSFANAKFTLKQHSPYTRSIFKNRIPWNKNKTGVYSAYTIEKMKKARKGRPGIPHTEETKEKLKGPNPKKGLPGKLNGMWGETHTDKVKAKLALLPGEHFKGKTYEQIYGVERAEQLKQDKSVKLKRYLSSNPEARKQANNANAKSYEFISPDNEVIIVEGRLKSFCKEQGLDCGITIDLLKGRRETYKGWQARYI